MTPLPPLRAPFPWFGGKSRAAHLVWPRFGDVKSYVEPFAGSLAVLLARPHAPQIETVNDLDCMVSNFWRALKNAPDDVIAWCDWPVNEADLHARHAWLLSRTAFVERMKTDPDYFDAKIAGWWVWGLSQWIGSGWCVEAHRKRPHLGNAGMGVMKPAGVTSELEALSARLRGVRVVCGDWTRVVGGSVLWPSARKPGGGLSAGVMCGVFLDPPYSTEERESGLYRADSGTVAADARAWAIENGNHPALRIALCGYEGEHDMPRGWESVAWKAVGGYGSQSAKRGRENAGRERIWFSPHCLKPERAQRTLF